MQINIKTSEYAIWNYNANTYCLAVWQSDMANKVARRTRLPGGYILGDELLAKLDKAKLVKALTVFMPLAQIKPFLEVVAEAGN